MERHELDPLLLEVLGVEGVDGDTVDTRGVALVLAVHLVPKHPAELVVTTVQLVHNCSVQL